jgi:hypothetical protein
VSYLSAWARAFLLTLLVELASATPLLGRFAKSESVARRLAAVSVANVASHPAVWFVIPVITGGGMPMLIVAESWAVLCEVFVYRVIFKQLRLLDALALSLLANAASLGIGLLIRHTLGWV